MGSIGKWLLITGGLMVLAGVILLLLERFSFPTRLPGDIVIRKKNFTFYFPLATSIVISLLITIIFYLINRFRQ
ncbi:MAG: DUF2905 domain-containing protein [Chloroflexi bacterium]|nr:DUF2905 domain-containing protein [Chloroflexota bacterium]